MTALTVVVQAPEALALLNADEKEKATKFYFLRDAKMSLGSSLLKRLFAAKTLRVSWNQVQFSRIGNAKHGKPCLVLPSQQEGHVDFNVSHQAGLVALAGCSGVDAMFGVDIVCINERNDYRLIGREGFDSYVDMHRDVFSDADVAAMKAPTPASHTTSRPPIGEPRGSQLETDAKLVRFYAYWCLKEAYIKLEGEGLLEPWLKDVEFRNVRCPEPGESSSWGETTRDIEVWFRGKRVENVTMVLQAYQENYMIGTAIKARTPEAMNVNSQYLNLNPEDDIYPSAQ